MGSCRCHGWMPGTSHESVAITPCSGHDKAVGRPGEGTLTTLKPASRMRHHRYGRRTALPSATSRLSGVPHMRLFPTRSRVTPRRGARSAVLSGNRCRKLPGKTGPITGPTGTGTDTIPSSCSQACRESRRIPARSPRTSGGRGVDHPPMVMTETGGRGRRSPHAQPRVMAVGARITGRPPVSREGPHLRWLRFRRTSSHPTESGPRWLLTGGNRSPARQPDRSSLRSG